MPEWVVYLQACKPIKNYMIWFHINPPVGLMCLNHSLGYTLGLNKNLQAVGIAQRKLIFKTAVQIFMWILSIKYSKIVVLFSQGLSFSLWCSVFTCFITCMVQCVSTWVKYRYRGEKRRAAHMQSLNSFKGCSRTRAPFIPSSTF